MIGRLSSFLRETRATTATEFAFVAPIYFLIVFGTLEIVLITWFSTLIAEGAEQGASYMRKERLAGRPFIDAGIRAAVCTSIQIGGLTCTDKLRIGAYYAGVPVGGSFGVPEVVENHSDPRGGTGEQYLLAVGYNWSGMGLPTAQIILPTGSGGPQISSRTYVVLAERVWDDGVRR